MDQPNTNGSENSLPAADSDSLSGVPGIGPARRALLAAAGITTRTELAQASIDQLISVTGMPRTLAERALHSLADVSPADSAPSTPVSDAPPSSPETSTEAPTVEPPSDSDSPTALPDPIAPELDVLVPEEEAITIPVALEQGVEAVRIALSDLTRLSPDLPRLDRTIRRFALFLDALSPQISRLRPRTQQRITRRLNKLAERLTKVVSGAQMPRPLGRRRAERLRERLRAERREIAVLAKLNKAARKRISKRNRR